MNFVEEIPRGSDPNVYFSSNINLKASKSGYSSSNTDQSRKRMATGAYNLSQLEANAHDSSINENLLEVRKSMKRFQEIDRENYVDQHSKLDLPRSGLNVDFKNFNSEDYPIFDLINYSNNINKNKNSSRRVKQGQTPATKKILASRKTINNYMDDDIVHAKIIKEGKIYPKMDATHALPGKKLCSICGSDSPNRCVRCGTRYCGVKCLTIHKETRCSGYYE